MDRPPLDSAALDHRTLGHAALRNKLLTLFREHGRIAIETAMAAVANRDAAAVTAAAHRLKGSAATIGAVGLADLAQRLEISAADKDWQAITADMSALAFEFRRCLPQIDGLLTS